MSGNAPFDGLRDILRILGAAHTPPTMTLWLADTEEGEEPDKCHRCNDPLEWIVALPVEGDDGLYGGTYSVQMCSTCLGSMIVQADEMTMDSRGRGDPNAREVWPIVDD